jgi:hypothetical protein
VETTLPITYCKRRLATVWFTGGGIAFFLVLVQSILGRYGEEVGKAWGWLLPTVLPTLSLIIGVLVYDAVERPDTGRRIDRFLFRLTVALSCGYLLAVLLVLLLTPLSNLGPIELMSQASVWLGPLQGLVAAAMGAFFVKAAREGQLLEELELIAEEEGRKDEAQGLKTTKIRARD